MTNDLHEPFHTTPKKEKSPLTQSLPPLSTNTISLPISQVQTHGTKHWGVIGASLNGRTGKQCRERWHNQLDPAIRKDPWTTAEEDILLRAHSVVSFHFIHGAHPLRSSPLIISIFLLPVDLHLISDLPVKI